MYVTLNTMNGAPDSAGTQVVARSARERLSHTDGPAIFTVSELCLSLALTYYDVVLIIAAIAAAPSLPRHERGGARQASKQTNARTLADMRNNFQSGALLLR